MRKRYIALFSNHQAFRAQRQMAHLDLLPDQKVFHRGNSFSVESPDLEYIVRVCSPENAGQVLRGIEANMINFFDFDPDEETLTIAKMRTMRRDGKVFIKSIGPV